jgi:hypothetical protein
MEVQFVAIKESQIIAFRGSAIIMDSKTVIEAIDKLLGSEEAAILSDSYYEQLEALRKEAFDLCEKDKLDDAKAILHEISQIVEEGPSDGE